MLQARVPKTASHAKD